MTTRFQDELVVFTAEAIVQAEWLRLLLDERSWHDSDDEVSVENVIRRIPLPHGDIGAIFAGRAGAAPLRHDNPCPTTGHPPHHVWATQRSPPRDGRA